jgi:acetyl esterase/lipase
MRTMRRVLPGLLGLALVASSLAGCDWPDRTRYVHEVFADYNVTTGIVYRQTTRWNGEPIQLRLDIYQPRGDTKAERPVMMWMFGGGWRFGDRNQLAFFAQDSARRGYVGVTIDYRTRGDQEPFDLSAAEIDAYDDTIAAIQWLQANAATYRIDPDAIVPAGFSAGAINALHAVWRPGTRGPTETPAAGAVAASGLSFTPPPADRPPVLMFNGTADPIVPYSGATWVCNQANAVGSDCLMQTTEGGGHSLPANFAPISHDFVFERILLRLGYRHEVVPPAS